VADQYESTGLAAIGSELEWIKRRLNELSTPDSSKIYKVVQELRQAVADIEQLVNNLADEVAALAASGVTWAGPVSTPGTVSAGTVAAGILTASANLSVGGGGTIPGPFYNQYAYDNEITYGRLTAWVGNDGRLGWASSSRTRKDNIEPAQIDPLAVLAIQPVVFNYKAELEKRAEDPDYDVALEFGAIAEDLDELGLSVVVDYDADGSPRGINYQMLSLLAVEAAKHIWSEHQSLEARVTALGG